MLLLFGTGPEIVAGVIVLVVAVGMRPRLGRPPRHVLDRAAAPTLYAVADRVAAAAGARPADVIGVDAGYHASTARVGLRRRNVLTLGLPLWETLTPGQRLALLGHEFAHDAGGDQRRGLVIETARRILSDWSGMLAPGAPGERKGVRGSLYDRPLAIASLSWTRNRAGAFGASLSDVGEFISRLVLGSVGKAAEAVHRLLTRLTERSGVRAEYLADRTAARIASARSAEGMLRALVLLPTAAAALDRMTSGAGPAVPGRGGRPADLWQRFGDYMASVPGSERARRLRLSELRGDALDPGHPPTCLRVAYVGKLVYPEPAVVVSEAETAAIAAELAGVRAALADELRH